MFIPLLSFAKRVLVRSGRIAYANRNAAIYALGFISLFTLIYWFMGLDKHFEAPEYIEEDQKGSFFNCMFTSVLTQSNAMSDYVPKSTVARAIFMIQVCIGWFWFLLFSNMI